MSPYGVVLILIGVVCASTEIPVHHETIYVVGCFESEAQAEVQIDGEEVIYADFKRREEVWALADFLGPIPPVYIPHFYKNAVKNILVCHGVLKFWKAEEKYPPEEQDAPESAIYPRDDVELGVDNTLICFVNHFYPPSIRVNWTKNDMVVTEGASLSRYYPNNDGTFHQFSTLSFTPQEGDIYSCTVEHTALEEPKTRIWDSEVSGRSVGPAVFCGVGLSLGVLGVATGIFLCVKCN